MTKMDRSKSDEVYPLTFVPIHLLPKKRPNLLDPFLEPIVSEIEHLFIEGIFTQQLLFTIKHMLKFLKSTFDTFLAKILQ